MRQLCEKALEPQGSSRPGWYQVAAFANALGLEPTWNRLKDIRSRLMAAGNPSLLDTQEVAQASAE
jgi:anaerobic selenocysteine-containing dehydrogenase